MGGWRSKLIFLLVVYFAGFATAVYNLGPSSEDPFEEHYAEETIKPELNSAQFMESFNTGLHKCVGFAKDVTVQAGRFIKEKIEERQADI